MPTTNIIGQYLDEDLDQDIDNAAKQLPNMLDRRKQVLTQLKQTQLDEGELVESIRISLPQADRVENLQSYRGVARKQYRQSEIQAISGYLVAGADNQNANVASLLDRLVEQIATDTSSDFTTLMTAITAANTSRNA